MGNAHILVTAATGLTGRAAVTALLKKGHIVRALAHREDDRSRALQALGAEVVEKITGTPPMSVEQFIAAHSEAFV